MQGRRVGVKLSGLKEVNQEQEPVEVKGGGGEGAAWEEPLWMGLKCRDQGIGKAHRRLCRKCDP